MKRRFIVLLDSATPEQDKEFKKWVKEQGFGYWHWLSQSWLLVSTDSDVKAGDVRSKAMEIYDECDRLLVLELRGTSHDTWAGFGPRKQTTNMFTWIKNHWG